MGLYFILSLFLFDVVAGIWAIDNGDWKGLMCLTSGFLLFPAYALYI